MTEAGIISGHQAEQNLTTGEYTGLHQNQGREFRVRFRV